jgi:HAD superfamily hydrolase (TIGR01490 family)
MEYAFIFVKGKNVSEIELIVKDFFEDILEKNIYSGSQKIIEEHQNQGREVILVSNAADVLIEKIAEYLNISEFLSTKLEIIDKMYTGNIVGDIMYGNNKVEALKKYLQLKNVSFNNCWAYADHTSDIFLLSHVAHPYTVNPTKKLKETAIMKKWPILNFKI